MPARDRAVAAPARAARPRALGATATIDVHAHVMLPGVLGWCGAAGPELGERDGVDFFRAGDYVIRHVKFRNSPMSDPDKRLALMDRLGIDHQIMSPYPMVYFYRAPVADAVAFARRHNDEMAALVRRHPDRLSGFATLPMQAPEAAAEELRRAVTELGLVASYVGGRVGERDLADPAYDALWGEHERLGVPVVVHPAPMENANGGSGAPADGAERRWDLDLVVGLPVDETLAIAALIFGGVLDRHPGLPVHVPHGSGFATFIRGRFDLALHKRPWGRDLLRRPLDELWRQLSFDCLVHDDAALRYLVTSQGPERVLLGTNFAAWDQDDGVVGQVRALPIAPDERQAILGANARRLFRL